MKNIFDHELLRVKKEKKDLKIYRDDWPLRSKSDSKYNKPDKPRQVFQEGQLNILEKDYEDFVPENANIDSNLDSFAAMEQVYRTLNKEAKDDYKKIKRTFGHTKAEKSKNLKKLLISNDEVKDSYAFT